MQILHNARVLTLEDGKPSATALAIENGVILAAGTGDEILAMSRPGTRIQDMGGRTIWPGLTDAHIHLHHYAASLQRVDCETDTLEECLRRVAEKARQSEPGAWILGHGWNHNRWGGEFPSAAQLDTVAPLNPVYLSTKSLHGAWVNTPAMQAARITTGVPDPEGGIIRRDAGGRPAGILLETAVALVEKVIPSPGLVALAPMLENAQTALWSMGLTGVHDFDGILCFEALQNLQQSGKLNLRVIKSLPLESLADAISVGLHTGFGNDFLRIGSLKLFADGALGPRTAAMLHPYENEATFAGMLFMDAEQIQEIGAKAIDHSLSLAIHAIGDSANHEVLNGFEQIRALEQLRRLPALRHRIEHLQILHPDDFTRVKQLNLIASMQPLHATSDIDIANRHWGERSENAYAWKSILATGATLAFGSDAPVESPNPFHGIHAAVTRCRQSAGPADQGWYQQQRLDLLSAVRCFTLSPAYASGRESYLGRLAAGYLADLIVLEQDPFTLPVQDIWHLQPSAVMVNGEWVWQA